jgi:hypothetical protein
MGNAPSGWRFPKQERGRFPAHWIISFGPRQTTIYSPVVRRRCAITTLRLGRRALGFYGIAAYRNEDDEPAFRLGLGLVEVAAYFLGFDRRALDDD